MAAVMADTRAPVVAAVDGANRVIGAITVGRLLEFLLPTEGSGADPREAT